MNQRLIQEAIRMISDKDMSGWSNAHDTVTLDALRNTNTEIEALTTENARLLAANCYSLNVEQEAIADLRAMTADRDHWKANHDAQVQRARVLIDREDLPLERVQAYEQIGILTAERDKLASDLELARMVPYVAAMSAIAKERDALKAEVERMSKLLRLSDTIKDGFRDIATAA